MSKPVRQPDPAAPAEDAPSFLRKLPWESITIWGLLLLVIYSLRHFFFVIFITFILTYIMRSVIVRILRFANLEREVPWLERCLAVVCFLLLFLALYGAGSYLQPHLNAQYLALEGRVKSFNPEREGTNLGAKTIGAYLFRRAYGDRDDGRYQEAFQKFLEGKLPRVVAYEEFKI
ncbi:MAG: hypothetical protein O7J95_09330, partial [Planctomycetota bacterium]|nr:hypothetical protein [Planctomycetota bacterium]